MMRFPFVLGLVLLSLAFMAGIWHVDIAAGAMHEWGDRAVTTNGWVSNDAVKTYHVGLYVTIASFVLLALLFARYVEESRHPPAGSVFFIW